MFPGYCRYTLTRDTVGGAFDISEESIGCGMTGVTCTKALVIELFGGTILITMARDAPIMVNYVTVVNGTYESELVNITIEYLWVIVFVPSLGLTVMWDTGELNYIHDYLFLVLFLK